LRNKQINKSNHLAEPFLHRVARADKPDLDLPMNAAPKDEDEIPELLGKYFSLDDDLNPVEGVSVAMSNVSSILLTFVCRVSTMARGPRRMKADGRWRII
jgi:hypothetical protein